MGLIPEMSLSTFRKLKAADIKKVKSFILTADGEYLGTVIIPRTSYVKCSAESLGQLSNTVSGRDMPIAGRDGARGITEQVGEDK